MYFCGVDIGKERHEACIQESDGTVVRHFPFRNSHTGFSKLMKNIEGLKIDTSDIQFCLEATGHYWLNLFCQLEDRGYKVTVVNPIQSDSMRNIYVRKTKTDHKDAFILADLLRFGKAQDSQIASEEVLSIQTLYRGRSTLAEQLAANKQRLAGILDRLFPELKSCFKRLYSPTTLAVLKEYPTPRDIVNADRSKLVELIRETSRYQYKASKADELKSIAKNSFGITRASDSFVKQLRIYIALIEALQKRIEELENLIDEAMKPFRSQGDNTNDEHVIESIPSVGKVTVAGLISEIGDINRFPNAKALVAFAGLDASVVQSGKYKSTYNRMSKRGSPHLRRTLWHIADCARLRIPEVAAYYKKKRDEGKTHRVAMGAVSRKILHIIYSVWKNQRPFDPQYQWVPGGQVKNAA